MVRPDEVLERPKRFSTPELAKVNVHAREDVLHFYASITVFTKLALSAAPQIIEIYTAWCLL
jgi:hypothetical protein